MMIAHLLIAVGKTFTITPAAIVVLGFLKTIPYISLKEPPSRVLSICFSTA